MVKNIYRGYEYDTDRKIAELRNQGERNADLVYRGVHHDSAKTYRQGQDIMAKTSGPLWYRGYRSA